MARRREKEDRIKVYELGQRDFTEEGRDGTKRWEKRESASFSTSPADPLKSSSWPFEMAHNVKRGCNCT
jgi:hypothetical protein